MWAYEYGEGFTLEEDETHYNVFAREKVTLDEYDWASRRFITYREIFYFAIGTNGEILISDGNGRWAKIGQLDIRRDLRGEVMSEQLREGEGSDRAYYRWAKRIRQTCKVRLEVDEGSVRVPRVDWISDEDERGRLEAIAILDKMARQRHNTD